MLKNSTALTNTQSTSAQTIPLWVLGAAFSGLLIFVGIVFRTYGLSVDPFVLENARQIGLPFMVVEMAFIFLAFRRGFNLWDQLSNLPRLIKIVLAIFIGTFWISSLFVSTFPSFAMSLTVVTATHIIFAVALTNLLSNKVENQIESFSVWMFSSLIAFTAVIAWHILSYPAEILGPAENARWDLGAIPGFVSLRMFGAYAGAIMALVTTNFLIRDKNESSRPIDFIALCFVSGLTVWSGTRAAILGVVVALVIAFFFCGFRPKKTSFAKLLACFLVGSAFSQFFIPYNNPQFYLIMYGDFVDAHSITSGRTELWLATLKGIADVPFFGAGAAGSSVMGPENWPIKHLQPHNFLLQFFATWGVIGGLPALFLLSAATWRAHKIVSKVGYLIPILVMLDSLLVMAFFDGTLYFAHHVMLVVSCYGIIFASLREPKKVA